MSSSGHRPVWPTVVLAFGLWFFTFTLPWFNFWIKISLSAGLLAALAVRARTLRYNLTAFDKTAFIQGLLAASALYGIFWLGAEASSWLFPFAPQQIETIYSKGDGIPKPVVFLLLLLVTGPCEEIYWRGFLQRNLMRRYGPTRGWIAATAIYAGVHILSFNFMLIGAAAVGGAFWGLLYWKLNRLDTLIICHSVWSAFIFTVAPIS